MTPPTTVPDVAGSEQDALAPFLAELAKSGGAMIRVACVLGFLSFFGMAFVDPWLVTGADLDRALWVRVTACALLAALFALTFSREWTRRHARALSHVACLVTGLTVIVLTYYTGGGGSDYHEALFIAMFGYAVLPVPWRRWDAIALYGFFLACYVVLLVALERTGPWGVFVTHVALIIAAGTIAVVLERILFRGRLREFVQRAALARANERLQALDEAKSRFFANLSHELRTPLTLTLAPLEALLESTRSPLSDSQREKLTLAQRNALRLLRLVDDLLALTRAESAALSLDCTPVDLAAMVKSLADDIAALAARKQLHVEVACEPAPLVEADAHLVERVLLNVIGNAAKFVGEGGRVRLTVRPDAGGVELAVADDGIGIHANDLPRIFDRFYQADSGSTRRTGGTGIGLALVREIMDLHGGRVWAESSPGQGTTVRCWFPLAPPAAARRPMRQRPSDPTAVGMPEWHEAIRRDRRYRLQGIDDATERRVAPRPKPRGPAPTVLVVEDNHDMIRFLVALLAYDFNVVTAQNGRDGLRLAIERRPDLIVSDIMMPEMDGIELVQALRASTFTRHIPFVFLTARGDVDDRLAGRQGGADIYLTKPFKSEELLAAVDTLLSRQTSMHTEMMAREDEVVVFMASGVVERMEPALAALEAARDVVASAPGALPTRFETGLQRLQQLGRELDALARAAAGPAAVPADVDATVLHIVEEARKSGRGPVIITDLEAGASVALRPEELDAVLLPLVTRARTVTPDDRAVTITTHRGGDGVVTLRVDDEGPTLAMPHIERFFYPYYDQTAHAPDGLDLARARRIVVARDGRITVESRAASGTSVIVSLPVAVAAGPEGDA